MYKKSLEISSSGLKILITKLINKKQIIIYSKRIDFESFNIFNNYDFNNLIPLINKFIDEAQTFSGISFKTIDIMVPNKFIKPKIVDHEVIRGSTESVSNDEIKTLLETLNDQTNIKNYTSIYLQPINFKADKKSVSINELKLLKPKKIKMSVIIYLLENKILKGLYDLFEKLNIDIKTIYPNGINLSEYAKNSSERMLLIDLGRKEIILTRYIQNILFDSRTINYGAQNIIDEVSEQWSISKDVARRHLEVFGKIPPEIVVDNRVISSSYDEQRNVYIEHTVKQLSEIITKHINKIFEIISDIIVKNDDYSLSLSGGLSLLEGIKEYIITRNRKLHFKIYKINETGRTDVSYINLLALNEIIADNNDYIVTTQKIIKRNDKISIGKNKIIFKINSTREIKQ